MLTGYWAGGGGWGCRVGKAPMPPLQGPFSSSADGPIRTRTCRASSQDLEAVGGWARGPSPLVTTTAQLRPFCGCSDSCRESAGSPGHPARGWVQNSPQWSFSFKALVTITKTKIVSPSPQSAILPRQVGTILLSSNTRNSTTCLQKITENILN